MSRATTIIDQILSRDEFVKQPPVLFDIGASQKIYLPWREIAQYAICIAFDADDRDIDYLRDSNGGYKKLFLFNKIATSGHDSEVDFYLTSSPYCSSTLPPDSDSLKNWPFADLFKIEKIVKLPAENVQQALQQTGLDYIDWFKSDSQGTDLRLFADLDREVTKSILAADFEPGIIDAYKQEDKLHQLMAYMDTLPFWINQLHLPLLPRLNKEATAEIFSKHLPKKYLSQVNLFIKGSPYCAEVSYFNDFSNPQLSLRDILLMWLFAHIKKQHGFAFEIALKGEGRFSDSIFETLKLESAKAIKKNLNKALFKRLPNKIIRFLRHGRFK